MAVVVHLCAIFIVLQMAFLLFRTYNLLPLMPSYSFPFMGYGVDAVLVNYLVIGIMSDAILKDQRIQQQVE